MIIYLTISLLSIKVLTSPLLEKSKKLLADFSAIYRGFFGKISEELQPKTQTKNYMIKHIQVAMLVLTPTFFFANEVFFGVVFPTLVFIEVGKGIDRKTKEREKKEEIIKENYNVGEGKAKKMLNLKQFKKSEIKKKEKKVIKYTPDERVPYNSLNASNGN